MLFDWCTLLAIEFSFDTDDGGVDTVADIESFDIEPALGAVSKCDALRLVAFFVGTVSARAEDAASLLSLAELGEMADGWPICDTVLHRLPNGGYLASALSLSSRVVW